LIAGRYPALERIEVMKMSVHLIRHGAFVLGALAATVAIAACGSSSTTSSSGSAAASASSTTSSGSGSGSGSASGRGGFARNPAQRAKLVACLKQHGVTLPARPAGSGGPPGAGPGSGSGSGSGSSSGSSTTPGSGGGFGGRQRGFFGGGAGANPKFRAALQACGVNFRGAGGRFNPAARKAAVNKFVTCVAQHGYKLPKPNFSGNGPVFPRNIESNPKFQAASKACAGDLRPPGAPQGGGGPPPAKA
jgi:hypothetical protein